MSTTLLEKMWLRIPVEFSLEPGRQTLIDQLNWDPDEYITGLSGVGLDFVHPEDSLMFFSRSALAIDTLASDVITKMARRFAYACWRLNQIERWWQKPAITEFVLHDRITHEPFSLNTAPSEWIPTDPWYSSTNLESLLFLIEDQFRTGGPSGKGASKHFVYQLIDQMRETLRDIYSLIWSEPPNGPGLPGILYGASWNTLEPSGARSPLPPTVTDTWTKVLTYGGVLPSAGYSDIASPTDPNATFWTHVKSWDYASGSPAPQGLDFYMPADRLKPDPITSPDEYAGWNQGYYNAKQHRDGVTSNSNVWAPDMEVLSEFNLIPHGLPNPHIAIEEVWEPVATDAQSDYEDSFGRLSTDPMVTGFKFWCDTRPFVNEAALSRSNVLHYFTAAPVDLTTRCSYEFVFSGSHRVRNTKVFQRLGVENDISGTPWKGTIWDWFCFHTGAVPDEIRLRGDLIARADNHYLGSIPTGLDIHGVFSFGAFENDEQAARLVVDGVDLGNIVDEVDQPFGANGIHINTVAFDYDWSDFLQSTPFNMGLYLAVTMTPAYWPPGATSFAGGGPFAVPSIPTSSITCSIVLRVVGLFGDQEVIFAQELEN